MQTVCLMILSAVALGATLYFLSSVLIPFVLALFFSICLGPIMDFLVQRLHLPRSVAVAGTLTLSFVLLLVIWMLGDASVTQMQNNADKYSEKLDTFLEEVEALADRYLNIRLPIGPTGAATEPADAGSGPGVVPDGGDRPAGPPQDSQNGLDRFIGEVFVAVAGSLVSILSQGVIVLVFVVFLLIGRRTHAPTTGLWTEIEQQITGYLTVKIVVSAITGVLVWAILSVLSVDLALVFGVFAFILNFVPNVGSVISTMLPLPVVFLAPDLSGTAKVLAIALPAAVQFAVGNVVEPKLMGRSLELHPVVILFALIFWGTLWGIIGVLLAVPITAVLKILFEKLGFLDPVVDLMAGRPPSVGVRP